MITSCIRVERPTTSFHTHHLFIQSGSESSIVVDNILIPMFDNHDMCGLDLDLGQKEEYSVEVRVPDRVCLSHFPRRTAIRTRTALDCSILILRDLQEIEFSW